MQHECRDEGMTLLPMPNAALGQPHGRSEFPHAQVVLVTVRFGARDDALLSFDLMVSEHA